MLSLRRLNFIGFVGLFLWISFYGLFTDIRYSFVFLSGMVILVLFTTGFSKGFLKGAIGVEDLFLCLFVFVIAIRAISAQNHEVVSRHFWSFIFPIPILYYFGKFSFRYDYGGGVLRALSVMTLIVCIFGIIEIIIKSNFIYDCFFPNLFFSIFRGRRMISTQIHPVVLATFLTALLPLNLAMFKIEVDKKFKILALVSFLLSIFCAVLTFTRMALASVLIAIFFSIDNFKRSKQLIKIGFIVAIVFIFIVILFSSLSEFSSLNNKTFLMYKRFTISEIFRPEDFSRRFIRLKAGIEMFFANPFLGIGLGNFRENFDKYLPSLAGITENVDKVPDLMYLTILAEAGVLGFLFFCLFIFKILRKSFKKIVLLPENDNRLVLIGFIAGFIVLLFNFFTYDGLYWIVPSYLFWIYAGILSADRLAYEKN